MNSYKPEYHEGY